MRVREAGLYLAVSALGIAGIGLWGCSSSNGVRSGSGGGAGPSSESGGSALDGGSDGIAGSGGNATLDGAISPDGTVSFDGAQSWDGVQGTAGRGGIGGSRLDVAIGGSVSGGVVGAGGATGGSFSGSDGGAEFSLLAGAVPFTGRYPAPGTVSVTVDGTVIELAAFPGQVIIQFGPPSPAWADAEAFLRGLGGTPLARVPEVGMYLVGVQPGSEDATIQAAVRDPRVSAADPNLVLTSDQENDAARIEDATPAENDGSANVQDSRRPDGGARTNPLVIVVEDDCQETCSESSKHAWQVATVLDENGARPTHCLVTGNSQEQPDEWSVLWQIVEAVDPTGSGRSVLFNLSQGIRSLEPGDPCAPWHKPIGSRDERLVKSYQQVRFWYWYKIIHVLASAFTKLGLDRQPLVAGSMSAGNDGIPLDPIIDLFYSQFEQDAERLGADIAALEKKVLEQNLVIVAQKRGHRDFESRFNYVDSWTATANASSVVVTTDNRWSTYGTSLAAPYALAQVYYLMQLAGIRPAEAIEALKRGASSGPSDNPDHTVTGYTGDHPPMPTPASDREIAPTDDSLFNCPFHSSWTQEDNTEAAKGYCLFDYRDSKAPMTVTSSASTPGLPDPVTTSTTKTTEFGVPLAWAERKPATPDLAAMQALLGGAGQMTELSCTSDENEECKFNCVEKAVSALGGSYVENVQVKYQRSTADGDFAVTGSDSLQGITMSEDVRGTFHASLTSLWPGPPGCPLTALDGAELVLNPNRSASP